MSKGREVDAWSKHQEYIANYIKYFQKDPKKELNSSSYRHKYSAKELDILHKNHRFLWNDDDATDLSWEQRIAKKYYDRLLKEYALVELKYYKIGRIAMRWRTEDEVIRGKGQFTCGCLRCDESEGLSSWEVNFAYVEMGEKKNVLVKKAKPKQESRRKQEAKPQQEWKQEHESRSRQEKRSERRKE
ncbi:hypothetical protein BGW41_006185 [Actinomortierella wolfii]|nr:hypothetical protein BGW41_006185 [Actinomortierella wolfii]